MQTNERCDIVHGASWSSLSKRDPDGTERNPSAQLGGCEPSPSAKSCCTACANVLGCLAWTFAGAGVNVPYLPHSMAQGRCCLKLHVPRHQPLLVPGCAAGILRSAPCRDGCAMPLALHRPPTNSTWQQRPRVADAAHFPWVEVHQRRQRRPPGHAHLSRRTPRIAVCIAGTTRSLVHPTVWRSLEQHVLGRSRVHHESIGRPGGLDVFAVLSTGVQKTP